MSLPSWSTHVSSKIQKRSAASDLIFNRLRRPAARPAQVQNLCVRHRRTSSRPPPRSSRSPSRRPSPSRASCPGAYRPADCRRGPWANLVSRVQRRHRGALFVRVWCRDSTGRFLLVMSQNATFCHCFWFNPLPGIEWFTGGLGGARGRLGCVGLSSGGLNPVVVSP